MKTSNNYEECEKRLKNVSIKNERNLMQSGSLENNLRHIFYAFSKKLEDNYEELDRFISLNDIDEVVILGHSILGVDEPYYRDVLIPKLGMKKWIFYCHGSTEDAESFIEKYELHSACVEMW